jgi:phosphoglycolate phosphatase
MLKHIIFDFDGTLADSSIIGLQILNELSDKYNYQKFSIEELRTLNSLPIRKRFKTLGVPFYKMHRLIIDAMIKYRELVNSLIIFEGISNLMISLKNEGYTLSIISSNSVDNIEHFIKKNELEYFDQIISVKNIWGKNKAIKSYLKKFNLSKDEIIYIGDELRDIQACKKLPVKIISVTWGFDSIDLLKSGNPDYIINKPEDILEIVKKIKQE